MLRKIENISNPQGSQNRTGNKTRYPQLGNMDFTAINRRSGRRGNVNSSHRGYKTFSIRFTAIVQPHHFAKNNPTKLLTVEKLIMFTFVSVDLEKNL